MEVEHKISGLHCPSCFFVFTVAVGLSDEEPPSPGAVFVCGACEALSVVTAGVFGDALRKVDPSEYAELALNPTVIEAALRAKRLSDPPVEG